MLKFDLVVAAEPCLLRGLKTKARLNDGSRHCRYRGAAHRRVNEVLDRLLGQRDQAPLSAKGK